MIQVNTYTPLGQLKQKKISEGNTILQTIDYTYNIRGWLTSINNPSQVSINGDLFAMNLHYNTEADGLNNQPMFSGNISAAEWQTVQTTGHTTPVTTGRKAYVYRYDQLSRLTNASFSDYTSGAWQASNRFNEKISAYDLNGNIKRLERKGSFSNWTTGTIDNLFYYYKGNQLVGVDDQVMSDNGYDFYDNGSYYNVDYPEFTYDANGNITRDANKGIIGISYDQNNLPTAIEFLNDNKLVYLYDVNGNKLRQEVIQSRILQKRTDFIGNFVMIDNEPAWLNFDEGRILLEDNSVAFTENHLHDHLGNTRVVYARINNALVVKQVNSFYPFGMNIKGLTTRSNIADMRHPANEYLYNGKMFQDELGLDWLDYGARMYDPIIGRFPSSDPISESFYHVTPYNYAENEPVGSIDLWGLQRLRIAGNIALTSGKWGIKGNLSNLIGVGGSYTNGGVSQSIEMFLEIDTKTGLPSNIGISYTQKQTEEAWSLEVGPIIGEVSKEKETKRELSLKDGSIKTEDKKIEKKESGGFGTIQTTEENGTATSKLSMKAEVNAGIIGVEAEGSLTYMKGSESNGDGNNDKVNTKSLPIEKEVKNRY